MGIHEYTCVYMSIHGYSYMLYMSIHEYMSIHGYTLVYIEYTHGYTWVYMGIHAIHEYT